MRKLIVSTFASLDGIMQAPGGPEEDPTGGFTLGGWMFGYGDESMDISASGFDGKDRELVLGRRTYQIFEAYWPYQPDDHPIAKTLNAAKKYVASRTLTMLHWNNSTLLHRSQGPTWPRPADDWQQQFDSNTPGRLTDRRVQRVDFSRGAWAGQASLQRDCQTIGAAARSLSGLDHRRCDQYLCTKRRYPARFVPECRAEREGVGPTQKDGE
jgi:dihydrofolate reductase